MKNDRFFHAPAPAICPCRLALLLPVYVDW